ncbi:unnamed protein product [Peronospora farinosa]|uniref:ribonuclease H n=1 Tax=Peronospora farinosa TaxID=134698 RepID=A0ABN8C4U5_9STRA|nr:unnamed protein product [Peronospora farinosa]
MAKGGFYAVAIGRSTGVFSTWAECEAQVKGYTGSKYKKFQTIAEAQAFVSDPIDQRNIVGRNRKRLREENVENESPRAQKLRKDTNGPSSIVDKSCYKTSRMTYTKDVDKLNLDLVDTKVDSKKAPLNLNDDDENTTSLMTMWKEEEKKGPQKSSVHVDVILEAAVPTAFAGDQVTANDDDPKDSTTLVAFCDGSALNNGRQKCRAGYACIFPHCEEWNVAKQLVEEERATNNRAEYMAALEAMKRANVEDPDGSRPLYIFSDSMLLIRSMTEWVGTWQKNNWRKSDGKPVRNHDLLELLVAEMGNRCIRWNHVKAHTGKKDWKSKWNDVADHAAQNAASSVGII